MRTERSSTAQRRLARALVGIVALTTACVDPALAPNYARGSAHRAAEVTSDNRVPELGACDRLAAPEGSTLVMKAFGVGVQIYHWNGTSWGAPTPAATLYADAGLHAVVATHFAGPTWKSNSGGSVVGTVADRCTPDASAIAWLLLDAAPDGPGIFSKVESIQRLNTVGGLAPSTPGSTIGEVAQVPYTADYLFYKAE